MHWLNEVLREQYGEKVYKLSLSSGCTCPNRDGTLGYGGCVFCSAGGSGDFAAAVAPLDDQIREAKARIARKTDAKKFIAYFQSYTNTYGDLNRLERLYREAMDREEVVLLSLATRPDCLGPEVLAMLRRLREMKPVWIELGLQTIHERTAIAIRRGYSLPVFETACRELAALDIPVITHVIFGLPGETRADMLATVQYLARMDPPISGVKLQMLHILRGTALGDRYETEPFPLLSLEEYADLVAESAGILPENTVFHRITGDAPGKLLLAPEWTRNKKRVLNTIHTRINQREYEGRKHG